MVSPKSLTRIYDKVILSVSNVNMYFCETHQRDFHVDSLGLASMRHQYNKTTCYRIKSSAIVVLQNN